LREQDSRTKEIGKEELNKKQFKKFKKNSIK